MKWPLFNLITPALVRSVIQRENEQNWKNEMAESLFNHVANRLHDGCSATSFIYTTWGKVQSVQSWGAPGTLPVRLCLHQWACWLDFDVRRSRDMNLSCVKKNMSKWPIAASDDIILKAVLMIFYFNGNREYSIHSSPILCQIYSNVLFCVVLFRCHILPSYLISQMAQAPFSSALCKHHVTTLKT